MASYKEIIEGLQILATYDEEGLDAHIGGAEHDVIYAGPFEGDVEEDDEGNPKPGTTVVSDEHAKRLRELGWHISSETDSWARFC